MKSVTRILSTLKIISEETNEDHCLNANEILERLHDKGYGEGIERKTVYAHIKELSNLGYEIESTSEGYYYNNFLFEPAELRVLIDSIKTSSFLTQKKSESICQRLAQLTNKYDREYINNGEYVAVKSDNEGILYNIDKIIHAMKNHSFITFKYYDVYPVNKKVYREKDYHIIPLSLVIDNNRYYLVSYSIKYNNTNHYRIDKMERIMELSEKYQPEEIKVDINEYMRNSFMMYKNERKVVELKCKNSLYQEVYLHFGDEMIVSKTESDYFICSVEVMIANTFYAWIFTFNGDILIISPADVKKDYYELCLRAIQNNE